MKHVFALAAIAGLLFSGCAPRPEPQGAAFDPNISAQETTPKADQSGLRYSPQYRSLGPHTLPGNSSEGISPGEDTSDESNPELMLPRLKNEVFSI